MDTNLLKNVEEYVHQLISEKSPEYNFYHNLDHTKEVVEAAIEIGKSEKVTESELEIIIISAWFHDTGYVEKIKGHEELSAMFASGFLTKYNYPVDNIDKIINCILVTKVPQHPKNNLEKIICDADLSHLGKSTFEQRNNLFRSEFEYYYGRKLTEHEWLIKSIEFVSQHNFFTDFAQNHFSFIQDENVKLLQSQLNLIK